MKKNYLLLLFLFAFSLSKGFSQACISLGCAANYGTQTTDGTLADVTWPLGVPSCYAGFPTKQVFWQFFKSTGGNYSQTFTPTSGANSDIDWIVYNMNATPASTTVTCAAVATNLAAWTEITCGTTYTPATATGPGLDGVVPTTNGNYYAVAIIVYQGPSTGDPASFTFTVGTPQLAAVNLTSANCDAVLPVKLTSFNAKVSSCAVNLDWTAASEANFKNYEIQYSSDGLRFQTIGSVAGTIQQGSSQKYSYQVSNPQQGKTYFRLKLTDIDGKYEFSKIIALKLDCTKSSIFVYPNPVTDVLNINLTNSENKATTASLFDNSGRLIYTELLKSGTNVINMEKFAKGIYMLRVKNNQETQNIKIVK